jgi:DNA-binding transcriptional MerR regulator
MEHKVTIQEIIDLLKREGLGLTRNQFWSYVEKGILPQPQVDMNGKKGIGVYPFDILQPLKNFLILRDQGIPLAGAKAALMEENLLFLSRFLKKTGMNMETLHHFALPNIEVDEKGEKRTDRGFSQFFIELLESTLWRSGKGKEDQAGLVLNRQLLKWKASLEAFWEKFDKVEPGNSWKEKRSKISQTYSEAITALNERGKDAIPV